MTAKPKLLALPPPFEEAIRRHDREIMRFLIRVTSDREDALDLFQETFLRAYRAYPQLDSEAGLRPWLFKIASNLCRNRARDRGRRSRVISGESSAESLEGVATNSNHSNQAGPDGAFDLRRAIAGLPGKQGQAFVMRKIVGLEYSEIGAALNCSEDSARAGVYQALRKLKELR
ncbi:MAG TPA: RNA polymerase sigma factor [Candidatus Binataceae bacterium]|jgi:RNA polymerase sigma-70 factor, ECF subfamily|nr:RNA polymerase sigma factor [Candidatus Binataceae bacterium]